MVNMDALEEKNANSMHAFIVHEFELENSILHF